MSRSAYNRYLCEPSDSEILASLDYDEPSYGGKITEFEACEALCEDYIT